MTKDSFNAFFSKRLSATTNDENCLTNITEVAVNMRGWELRTTNGNFEISYMHLIQLMNGETVRTSFMGYTQELRLTI